ncbi:hypothetical protein JXA85_02950, partial [Candidatus Woesearchaeota archaeon]|nr:hypothetical protein [Candidatus Woesearchaeota archaeon]
DKMEYQDSMYKDAFPSYLENSLTKPRPFYHTGMEQSLENIVFYEGPTIEPAGILSDKKRTLKSTIKALFNEIMLRERIDSFLLYRIEEDICRQHNYYEGLRKLFRFNYHPETQKHLHDKKIQMESNVLNLEQEKRKEYLECWKDLMGLKKDLFSALKDYWLTGNRGYSMDPENDRCRDDMQEAQAYNRQAG